MNYIQFRNIMQKYPVFSISEIEKQFPGFDSRRLVEWQKKGYIEKLRNKYYYFADQSIEEGFLFYTANNIYSPSYISLESALSIYNIIPEGVFQITCITTRKTNLIDTSLGEFKYRHIKSDLYFGYSLKEWRKYRYSIAEPEKAIIDFLYYNPVVKDVEDLSLLRWNPDSIRDSIEYKKLEEYRKYIDSKTLNNRISLLKEFIDAKTK